MDEKKLKITTSLVKLIYVVVVSIYPFLFKRHSNELAVNTAAFIAVLLLFSLFILADIFERRSYWFTLSALVISIYLFKSYSEIYLLCTIPLLLDLFILLRIQPFFGLMALPAANFSKEFSLVFILVLLGFCTIYYLIFIIIKEALVNLASTSSRELSLKNRLNYVTKKHTAELMEASLRHENNRLAELGSLSQKLHDKVGHSMSGSLFKLEGAKLLIGKDPQKSREMLEDVIALLRSSIDEIRQLLRREKPDAGEVNINKLKMLFANFTANYEIISSFEYEGDIEKLSPNHWSILIENTVEALTNALRYSECNKISAKLYIYHKIIRYQITDDGKGFRKLVKGMGLAGMEERLVQEGGSITFAGESGFEINMLLPIN